jgi:predicted transposase YbfD/YdcC
MGCQKEIVGQVVTGGGDCVIAVKDNQPKLLAAIRTFFLDHLERDLEDLRYRYHETVDDGHGRVDERSYYLAKVPRDFAAAKDWPWVKSIGYSVRITRHADGRESDEVRYYLSSRYLSGKRFGEAVRGHWGIESMHWVLDVNFREDESRTRERTLGNNLSWLRRFAVTLLKRHPDKDSLRGKMISCGLNTDFLTAYPSRPADRYVIQAQTKCNIPKEFSTFFSQRIRMRRNRFIQLCVLSTAQRRAFWAASRLNSLASSPRALTCAVKPNSFTNSLVSS